MMRLWWSSRSPYVRKVTVALHELGLADRVQLVPVTVSQRSPQANSELAAVNPMATIPTLEFDDGTVLADSTLICLALDRRSAPGSLVPEDAKAMTGVLARVATASLMIDAAMQTRFYAGLEADGLAERIAGYRWKLNEAFDTCDRTVSGIGEGLDLGAISLGVALSYLDFRLPHIDWRDGRPKLTAWHEVAARRPSFAATAFKDA